jgi:hypothetical protein
MIVTIKRLLAALLVAMTTMLVCGLLALWWVLGMCALGGVECGPVAVGVGCLVGAVAGFGMGLLGVAMVVENHKA